MSRLSFQNGEEHLSLGARQSRTLIRSVVGILITFSLSLSVSQAATLPSGFSETQIASLSNGTAMAFAPDGRLFVCQQTGQLRVIKNGGLLGTPFVTLTAVDSSGERGLLGVAFDPNFVTNQFVYVYYTASTPSIHNRVSRFTANGDVAVAGSEVVILDLNNLSGATNHNGGAIHFGPDGKLYIAVGENANAANAQTLTNLLGKVLRINPDPNPANLIPSDNPFFNDPNVIGNNKAIWALGLRNPFTFGFQPGTGRLFINDVGQSAWEEINDGIAGSNYGWSACEGACAPPNANFRDPIFQYSHDGSTCAIVGGAFYNPPSPQFPAVFIGKYFYADLCAGWIHRFDPATNTSVGFASGLSAPVDLQVASDGSLYYLVRGGGAVFRIFTSPTAVSSVRFTADSYMLDEAAGSITIMVTRSGDSSLAATVDYVTNNGSADQRVDYTSTAGTLRFAPFETIQTLTVLITDDGYVEGDETVNIALSNPTGGLVLGAPTTAVLHISDNDIVPPTTNPAEDARFFVRQQYHDFLNREPDQSGWDYWTNQLTQCGTDQLCLHQRRIGVSDAFFFEPEFQETGSYVYRVYKAAFGNRPSYALFIADRSRVVTGPQLAQSKADFANAFVQRPAFTSQYPASMTAAQYVDALNASSGNPLTAAQRDALVNGLIAGTETRGSVLRKIADTQTFVDREYNSAFVLMEYFLYLRRDPDQGGFDFWFFQVNQFPPRAVVAQYAMVCAFLTSREYQERFGAIVTRSNAQCGQ